MGRPRQHDTATRLALLDAAEQLVDQHGPDAASVRAIADAVGTTTRAVYSLFGSKDGLLAALAARLFSRLTDAIDATPRTDDPAADLLAIALRGFRRTMLAHPALFALVFWQATSAVHESAEFRDTAAAAFGRLEAAVARLGAIEPASAARTVHAVTEGLASMELRGAFGTAKQAERAWRETLATVIAGIAAGTRPD